MPQQVSKDTRQNVKIPTATWESVSHEAIDRRSSIYDLIAIAWSQFMALPEAKRDKMVRDYEQEAKARNAA